MSSQTSAAPPELRCPQCGQAVGEGNAACPYCGALLHRDRLEQLSAGAMQIEATNPAMAAAMWRQCLRLLPPGSQQAQWVASRAESLAPTGFGGAGQAAPPPRYGRPAGVARVLDYAQGGASGETWQSALLKTGGSMAFSIYLFSNMAGWKFAVGLVLLIFVHEMGHVLANWHFGIRQSAPIFVGIFGAVIFLRGAIQNAWQEAVSGIAGPLAGSIPALACFVWFEKTGDPLAGQLAFWGCFLNLWNLIPVPPLDGGRAAAAITPFVWPIGLVGLIGVVGLEMLGSARSGGGGPNLLWLLIVFWILAQSFPRVKQTVLGGEWRSPYYRVPFYQRAAMTAVVGGLAFVLIHVMSSLPMQM